MDEYTNNLTDNDFELYLSDVLTPAQFKKIKSNLFYEGFMVK